MITKDIQTIIKDFEASSLTILELEMDNFRLHLSKQKEASPVTSAGTETTPVSRPEPLAKAEDVLSLQCVPVKSPLVGTFYASATQTGEPFVKVGQTVQKGDTVCIIEAMKIMNEIASPASGVIERIDVKNGQVVGYDQVLITIHAGEGHGK
jgi:acetyl-CoA carboxylase biotin carboxyl carrier protein